MLLVTMMKVMEVRANRCGRHVPYSWNLYSDPLLEVFHPHCRSGPWLCPSPHLPQPGRVHFILSLLSPKPRPPHYHTVPQLAEPVQESRASVLCHLQIATVFTHLNCLGCCKPFWNEGWIESRSLREKLFRADGFYCQSSS